MRVSFTVVCELCDKTNLTECLVNVEICVALGEGIKLTVHKHLFHIFTYAITYFLMFFTLVSWSNCITSLELSVEVKLCNISVI